MAARYVLVPSQEPAPPPLPGVLRLRRFRLARVGLSPPAALGHDRHERLERLTELERRLGPGSAGPADD
jgi:hypothetical protein